MTHDMPSAVDRGAGAAGVSVVIPTIGRPEIRRAIDSVRSQAIDGRVEVVVVCDRPVDGVDPDLLTGADQVMWTGGGLGGSAARNIGIAAAECEWVAFLDDDDEWVPGKLAAQVAAAGSVGEAKVVVSSRHIQVDASGRQSAPVPVATKSAGQSVAAYLFLRRRPGGGRASMYTSTLLCRTALARAVPWDATLRRHQDWDWLLRLERDAGAEIIQVDEALTLIHSGSSNSISAGSQWAPSLAWATDALAAEPAQVQVDFLVAQTFRYALAARSWAGVRAVSAAVIARRRLPSLGPVLIGVAGLIPRHLIERLMIRLR